MEVSILISDVLFCSHELGNFYLLVENQLHELGNALNQILPLEQVHELGNYLQCF